MKRGPIHRFEFGLALRLTGMALLILASGWTWSQPGLVAARIVAGILVIVAAADLWHYLDRTNRAVARFIEAVRFDDFSQRFTLGKGGGFEALGRALDNAVIELGRRRSLAADEARFLAAVVDDAPVPLLMIQGGDHVTLLNKAARRQFGTIDVTRLPDFARLGPEFVAALGMAPAGRRLTRLLKDGIAQRVIIESARIDRLGEDIRIVSVMPVQKVLGSAEMAAQSDLVRVLTHEIMNSLTPVTSLARTAADLLAAADLGGREDLADVKAAIDTVARRAEGMHRFVESYRAFARPPEVRRQRFAAAPWADEIARLFAADPTGALADLQRLIPPNAAIDGDPELLAQLCLNLLRNGAAAATGAGTPPRLTLAVTPGEPGATLIEVGDNGPGIPPDRRNDIFLPFYTTRADGHGVGLSFVHQVVIAHGGSIAVDDAPGGGARFRAFI
ncbi:histidine kinase [Polymorphobacter glacialis]|uniref:histidine kinase n=1 Tax=Sandarakinorhabdus glacialis TaxID=1614636 RepID=A0A916ZJA9_9SPHN|nr:ATP-binding protein [Polymorphobacter glacialis]GGE00390.1 histidine kinase [Polymorphobacter glacialis]